MERTKLPQVTGARIELEAAAKAAERARIGRWDLDIAVFLFAVIIIVVILSFQGVAVEIVSVIAFFGLSMVWLVGWRRGKQLFKKFYVEELARSRAVSVDERITEETIEELVLKALRNRLGKA